MSDSAKLCQAKRLHRPEMRRGSLRFWTPGVYALAGDYRKIRKSGQFPPKSLTCSKNNAIVLLLLLAYRREQTMTELIRVSEAAALLQVHPQTVRNLIIRGYFPGAQKIDPARTNSPIRIPKEEVKQYIQSIQPQPDQTPDSE